MPILIIFRRNTSMKKTLIGIVPLVDTERESYWMLPGYMKAIEQAGGIPVMMPLTSDPAALQQLNDTFDGFLFTGGHDVSPTLYGQSPSDQCEACCKERDEMEKVLFSLIFEQDKPALGICRGIQLINVLMGGTLYQDLPTEHPSSVIHRQKPPYDIPAHAVEILRDSPLYDLLGRDSLMVNSCHHQAICKLAPGLSPMAVSDDGLMEAVYAPEKTYLQAVQWHPEFSCLSEENSRKIFSSFLTHCRIKA